MNAFVILKRKDAKETQLHSLGNNNNNRHVKGVTVIFMTLFIYFGFFAFYMASIYYSSPLIEFVFIFHTGKQNNQWRMQF